MKKARLFSRFLAITVVFSLVSQLTMLADQGQLPTLVVDDDKKECPDAGFKKIQDAINAANGGEQIKVCPGIYQEQIVVSKSVKVVGQSGATLSLKEVKSNSKDFAMDEPLAAFVLVKNTQGVVIENLKIDGKNSEITDCTPGIVGVAFQDASGIVKHVEVTGLAKTGKNSDICSNGFGIFVQSSDDGEAEVLVEENTLHDLGERSIVGVNMGTILRAKENLIVGTKAEENVSISGVYLDFGATGTIQGNRVAQDE